MAAHPKAYTASGLKTVYAGVAAATYFHVPAGDSRVPDIFGISQYGVVFMGKMAKIAGHGGANPQDRSRRFGSSTPSPAAGRLDLPTRARLAPTPPGGPTPRPMV
jgi:hypothetical protein